MIPTAEEFFLSKLNPHATGGLSKIEFDTATEIAIEFAQLCVKDALEAASQKATIKLKDNEYASYYWEDYVEGVDKSSILTAYPITLIK